MNEFDIYTSLMYVVLLKYEFQFVQETLSDSKGDDNHAAIIKGLNPYTNYTICIMSRVDGSYSHMKGPCRTVQTLQASMYFFVFNVTKYKAGNV